MKDSKSISYKKQKQMPKRKQDQMQRSLPAGQIVIAGVLTR